MTRRRPSDAWTHAYRERTRAKFHTMIRVHTCAHTHRHGRIHVDVYRPPGGRLARVCVCVSRENRPRSKACPWHIGPPRDRTICLENNGNARGGWMNIQGLSNDWVSQKSGLLPGRSRARLAVLRPRANARADANLIDTRERLIEWSSSRRREKIKEREQRGCDKCFGTRVFNPVGHGLLSLRQKNRDALSSSLN